MRKFGTLISFAAILMLSACADQTTYFVDFADEFFLENSELKLESSINYDNAGVLDIYESDSASGTSGKVNNDFAGDYPLTLVAQIDPPSYQGTTNLTATHVAIVDEYAYVSYNTAEDNYWGAIDIIRISDPTSPVISNRLFLVDIDANALAYENGFVYVVGGVDSEKSAQATSNSVTIKIAVENGRFNLAAGVAIGFQPGYNATSVKLLGNTVVVGSGKEGSMTAFSQNDLTTLKEVAFDDIRDIAIKDNALAILDASKGVSFLDTNFAVTSEIPTPLLCLKVLWVQVFIMPLMVVS